MIEDLIKEYLDELSRIPARDQRHGKKLKYSPITLADKKGQLRYIFHHGPVKLDQDISLFTSDMAVDVVNQVAKQKCVDSLKYFRSYELKAFLEWCIKNGYWNGEIKFEVLPTVKNNIREIPLMKKEKWLAIRRNPRNQKGKTILSLMFNQFRVWEIMNLQWDNMPESFFEDYEDAVMESVLRKGGEKWTVKVDRECWEDLKSWWNKRDRPEFGSVFGTRPDVIPTHNEITKHFYRARNRVLYKPEDKRIRDRITPHAIRHWAAQQFANKYPHLAATLGPVLGGWVPGSREYMERYLNLRNTFPTILKNAGVEL